MIGIINKYFDDNIKLLNSISATVCNNEIGLFKGIEESCRLIKSVSDARKKVIFVGNGGSAAIAGHMAIDFWKNGNIKALAFNDGSQLTCLGNDYGYEYVFEKPIEMFAEEGDLLFAISSSGQSKNILNAVKAGQKKNCSIITLSGFKEENSLRKFGNINFYIPSNEYGYVEVLHQFICHFIFDVLMEKKKSEKNK